MYKENLQIAAHERERGLDICIDTLSEAEVVWISQLHTVGFLVRA